MKVFNEFIKYRAFFIFLLNFLLLDLQNSLRKNSREEVSKKILLPRQINLFMKFISTFISCLLTSRLSYRNYLHFYHQKNHCKIYG